MAGAWAARPSSTASSRACHARSKVSGDPAELASFDPFFTFFKGGVAAFEAGVRVGAIGVSGLPGEEDDRVARDAVARAGLELE